METFVKRDQYLSIAKKEVMSSPIGKGPREETDSSNKKQKCPM